MAREKGLSKQVQDVLDSKLKIGSSKHLDKKNGVFKAYIYSGGTYRTYLKHNCYFVKWCKSNYGSKNLEQCKPHINDYLQMRIDNKISPYTQKLEASAIAKLYGCSTNDFVKTEVRHRRNITRNRGEKIRDKNFSEKNNQEFIDFCKSTGLRRSEITGLKKDQLHYDEQKNEYYLIIKGKGGRVRQSPILSQTAIDRVKQSNNIVWHRNP